MQFHLIVVCLHTKLIKKKKSSRTLANLIVLSHNPPERQLSFFAHTFKFGGYLYWEEREAP